MKKYIAHIQISSNGEIQEQTVTEHCRNTAEYAGKCLNPAGLFHAGYLAGLLHDVEKNTEPKLLLQKLRNSDILFSDADALLPQLWHAPAGMLFVRDRLGIRDPDVLNAIRYHTTGRKNMSPLEKTVYLADLTSADRDFPDVELVRKMSETDPDGAIVYSLQFILGEMLSQGKILHPDSLECYNQITAARTPIPQM